MRELKMIEGDGCGTWGYDDSCFDTSSGGYNGCDDIPVRKKRTVSPVQEEERAASPISKDMEDLKMIKGDGVMRTGGFDDSFSDIPVRKKRVPRVKTEASSSDATKPPDATKSRADNSPGKVEQPMQISATAGFQGKHRSYRSTLKEPYNGKETKDTTVGDSSKKETKNDSAQGNQSSSLLSWFPNISSSYFQSFYKGSESGDSDTENKSGASSRGDDRTRSTSDPSAHPSTKALPGTTATHIESDSEAGNVIQTRNSSSVAVKQGTWFQSMFGGSNMNPEVTPTFTKMDKGAKAKGVPHDNDLNSKFKKMVEPQQNADERAHEVVGILFSACKGDITTLKRYASYGLDMGQGDYDRRTALHLAAAEGHLECVEYLLHKCNVDPAPKDRWGHTPINEAKLFEHEEISNYINAFIIERDKSP